MQSFYSRLVARHSATCPQSTLQPIGAPRFTNSITQNVFAAGNARYVGISVVNKSDDFIESVDKSMVPGSVGNSGAGKVTQGWWMLGQSGLFEVTFETKKGTGTPASYAGLEIEISLADANRNVTNTLNLMYTNSQNPGGEWAAWGQGWFKKTSGGTSTMQAPYKCSPPALVPAPGAIALAVFGLGLCGFRRTRES